MDSLILFLLVSSSLCLLPLPLAADDGTSIAGLTSDIEVGAIKSIFSKWNISAWKPYLDLGSDPCNANGTAWPYIECTECHLGAPSGSCHIISLNLSSLNIDAGIPPELFNLQWLKNLSLCNNSISGTMSQEIGMLSNLIHLDLSANNFSGEIPEAISNITGLTYLNLSKNMLLGSVASKLGNILTLSYLDLSVNMLSGNVPSGLGKLHNLQVLKFGTNEFSGPLPDALGNLTSLEELYLDSSGVNGSLDVLKPLKELRILWAFDNDINGNLSTIRNFSKLEELRIYGTLIEGPIPHFSDPASIQILYIGDLLPPSDSFSPSQTGSDFSFLANMDNLSILSLRNCSLASRVFPSIPALKNLTYLDLSFNTLRGKIPPNYTAASFPKLTKLFIGGNNFDGNLDDIISESLLTGELDISFNPISGDLPSDSNLNINFLGTKINAQAFFSDSRSSDILGFIGNNSKNISNLSICSPFAIKCGANVHNISDLSYYHNDSNRLGAADLNIDTQYQWVVSNVGSFLPNSTTIDSIVITDHSISEQTIEHQVFYQTARISASSLRYYILGLPDGDGYKLLIDFAEIVIEEQKSWRGLGRRYFNIFVQGNMAERDFNIVDAAHGSYKVVTRSYENVTVRNRTVEIHFQWAGRGTCCIPHEYTYGPLVSAIRVQKDKSSSCASPPVGKTAREKAGVAVGILSLGIASLLISSSIMYLWWKWVRLGKVMKH